jgi:hypothetical protein
MGEQVSFDRSDRCHLVDQVGNPERPADQQQPLIV